MSNSIQKEILKEINLSDEIVKDVEFASVEMGTDSVSLGLNSFAIGNQCSALGDESFSIGVGSEAGVYGWYYEYVDFSTGTFYLTDTRPEVTTTPCTGNPPEVDHEFQSGFSVGDVVSYVNKNKNDLVGTITSIDGNKIVVGALSDVQRVETETKYDDWSIFSPSNQMAGGVWFGNSSFAMGTNARAANMYSFSHGKDCLAYGQYSHAEGRETSAGYAAHSEG